MTEHETRVASDGILQPGDLHDRRVLVLGLGVSGRAVASALLTSGAKVLASDAHAPAGAHPELAGLKERGLQVEAGGHKRASRWLAETDLVVPSPGISPRSGILAEAIAEGVPVLAEIELASRFARAPVIAVTGTNGKTTTCRMIGAMLNGDGRDAVVCGNIGRPFISAAIEHPSADAFVVEVSSFQLTFCYAFHPQVAVVTNFAPDHLDWHGSMDAYRVAKSRIAARQTRNDWFVYPADQPDLSTLAPAPGPRRAAFSMQVLRSGDGVWLDRDEINARMASGVVEHVGKVNELARFGLPIVQDALAATAAALAFGVAPESVAEALSSFRPDHHRIEPIGALEGVDFVDDSKATNPHASLAALRNFSRVILIAGGRNKGLDLSALRAEVGRLCGVVAIGEAADQVAKAFRDANVQVQTAKDMDDAVHRAFAMAGPGDVVLLSPACSSFDQFESYAQRGDKFREAYDRLRDEREDESR